MGVALSALILGAAIGAVAILAASADGKPAATSLKDLRARALDLIRSGREKLERAADDRS